MNSKKDKKVKPIVKPRKEKPSYYSSLYQEYLEEIKHSKLYYGTIFGIFILFVISIYLQYNFEKAQRYDPKKDNEIDYFEILGIDSGADLATINKKYRELAKIWHPDKNPGCTLCHEKYLEITKAHEVLSSDANLEGRKSVFSSNPVVLTTRNFHKQVEMSNDFWIILVYENAKSNSFFEHVKGIWEEVSLKNKGIIKFGVIDILSQENLLHFLPYKFQYFPNIYTYNHNECELFSKIDQITPTSKIYPYIDLQIFIENSFISQVKIIDELQFKGLLDNVNKELDISNQAVSISDLDVQVINLSARQFVDLSSKDFAMTYSNCLKVMQNEYGNYEKFIKILKSEGTSRTYIIYNKIVNKKDSYLMERKLSVLPVTSKYESTIAMQKSYNLVKSQAILRIFSQNYNKHCLTKRFDENSLDKEIAIDICVIFLESKQHKYQDSKLFKSFVETVQEKFEYNIKNYDNNKTLNINSEGNTVIDINYGIADIDQNYEIKNLLKKYQEQHNIQFSENDNLFFIINLTNEKFVFKQFKTREVLKEYFINLNNNDYFEDITLSFDFFANFEVKAPQNLFVEDKHFSIVKSIISSFYSQLQAMHVFCYIVLLIVNLFFLKYDGVKFLLSIFSVSLFLSFSLSLISFFF